MHIYKRFPEKIQVINQLIEEDPDFLAICEDHDACVNALRHWSNSQKPEAKARSREYRVLVQKLEEEIEQAFPK